jgi:hypothetical protein
MKKRDKAINPNPFIHSETHCRAIKMNYSRLKARQKIDNVNGEPLHNRYGINKHNLDSNHIWPFLAHVCVCGFFYLQKVLVYSRKLYYS